MQKKSLKQSGNDVIFTQEDCYTIIRENSLVVVDPFIFSPLAIDKRIRFHLGLYFGYSEGSEKIVLDLCSWFKERYENMQFSILHPFQSKMSLPNQYFTIVNYEGPEGLAQFYSNIDVFLFLDDKEESYRIVPEAMSCGTPVISKTLSKSCFKNGKNILFFNHTRPTSLFECIVSVLEDYEYKENLIREGFNCAKQFNPSPLLRHFERIINETYIDEDKISVSLLQSNG
jgi:glycosyltransferase involved in cell wall biosynthesis